MTTTPVDPGSVEAGDFVHLGTSACPGDSFLEVLAAPVGKMYVAVKLLGVPRWVHRADIRSAIRRAPEEPSLKLGPILDIPI